HRPSSESLEVNPVGNIYVASTQKGGPTGRAINDRGIPRPAASPQIDPWPGLAAGPPTGRGADAGPDAAAHAPAPPRGWIIVKRGPGPPSTLTGDPIGPAASPQRCGPRPAHSRRVDHARRLP